jgi:hypothetical protein
MMLYYFFYCVKIIIACEYCVMQILYEMIICDEWDFEKLRFEIDLVLWWV